MNEDLSSKIELNIALVKRLLMLGLHSSLNVRALKLC